MANITKENNGIKLYNRKKTGTNKNESFIYLLFA